MFATVNGVRLFFDVLNPKLAIEGDALCEKPVLICLPGGPGGDHQTLRPVLDTLSEVAQVIYLDPRASGRSDPGARETWTLDQWGDDVAAFCDVLGIARPIVLGVSGGALIVQAWLARHPDQAGAAIFLNPCARMDRDAIIAGFEALGGEEAGAAARAMYTRGAPEDVPAFFQHCLPHYTVRKSFDAPPGGNRATFNFAVSQHFFQTGGEAFRFDFRNRLGGVTCPVLAIAGAHDPVTRAEWGRELADALPSGICDYVELASASHMVIADESEAVFGTIRRFIASQATAS